VPPAPPRALLLQAGTEAAADRGPTLALAIVGNQAVRFCRAVELVFDISLFQRTGCDPAAERPGRAIECCVAAAMAGQVILPARIFARRARLGTQRSSRAASDVAQPAADTGKLVGEADFERYYGLVRDA
jgi:hypothetical protein